MKALGSRSSLGGIVLLGVFATVAVAGHLHGDSLALVGEPLTPPSATHPFGTDFLGRDLLARTGRGATTSALVAGASVGLATLIATPIGMVTGWFSHRGAAKVMRWAVELLQVVPRSCWWWSCSASPLPPMPPCSARGCRRSGG